MSPKIPSVRARDVIRCLEHLGFQKIRQKGSHVFFQHQDGRTTVVSVHPGEDIGKGLLRSILREAKISPEQFLENL